MPTSSTGVLQIIGAVYGLKKVTAQVIKLVNRQASPETLSVLSSKQVFGDAWPGNAKMLTVIYRYDGGPTYVATAMEGQTLSIGAQQFDCPAQALDETAAQPALKVWGVSYGPADGSATVSGLIVRPAETLPLVANNDTFGDSWYGTRKSFVVVASYTDQVPFIDIVIESTPYPLTFRPHLQILSAFYGLKDVTDVVLAKVSRSSFWHAIKSAQIGNYLSLQQRTVFGQ